MKKIFLFSLLFLLLFNSNTFAVEVSAPHAILIDLDSGKTLFQKDAYSPVYPASTTKILTAILTLENCDLNETATASFTAINSVYAGGTTANIQEGETHTVRDLLCTLLVHSANDAAYILAEHIGGSTASFASMMNARAKELGALSTYFVNPNGLPDASHKCSAYDMSLFAKHAMKNFPEFREIVKMTSYSLPVTKEYEKLYFSQFPNASEATRYLSATTNHLINPNKSDYYYEYATGIKTGYTDSAANCIVASAEKDGVELVVVLFGASGWKNLRSDCVNLFEYGFSRLRSETLATAGSVIDTIKIKNGATNDNILNLIVEDTLKATFSSTDLIEAFSPSVVINSDLKAPIKSGEVVGTITYDIYNSTYSSNLIAGNAIDEKVTIIEVTTGVVWSLLKIVLWFVAIVLGSFITLVLIRAYIITKRQRERSHRRAIYNSRFR